MTQAFCTGVKVAQNGQLIKAAMAQRDLALLKHTTIHHILVPLCYKTIRAISRREIIIYEQNHMCRGGPETQALEAITESNSRAVNPWKASIRVSILAVNLQTVPEFRKGLDARLTQLTL